MSLQEQRSISGDSLVSLLLSQGTERKNMASKWIKKALVVKMDCVIKFSGKLFIEVPVSRKERDQ